MNYVHLSSGWNEHTLTREDLINELAENCSVKWVGYGTWEVSSYVWVGGDDIDDKRIHVKRITHDEGDAKGIMDGERYNPLCGFANEEEIAKWVKDYGYLGWKSVEEVKEETWSDAGNEDNYEPTEEKYRRLGESLVDKLIEKLEEEELGIEIE